jgi:hypothetical protein
MNDAERLQLRREAIQAALQDDADALNDLAKRAVDAGDLRAAVPFLLASVGTGGDGAAVNLGTVLKELGQCAAAAEAWRYAVEAGMPDVRVYLGNLLRDRLGQPAAAEREYRLAAEEGERERSMPSTTWACSTSRRGAAMMR